jgi:hypothetical protein
MGRSRGPVIGIEVPTAGGESIKAIGPRNRVVAYARRVQQQGGNRVDFRTHSRQQLEATQRDVQAMLNDPHYMNERVRHEEAMRVAREGQQAHLTAVQEAMQAYDEELARLERIANPPPQRGRRSTAEMMERRELLDMNLPRWERAGDEVILDEYRQALAQGDQMMVELIEDFGSQYIKDHARNQEFGDLVYEQKRARLPESAKNALTQLEALVGEEYKIKAGMSHQQRTMASFVENIKNGQPVFTREDGDATRRELAMSAGGR